MVVRETQTLTRRKDFELKRAHSPFSKEFHEGYALLEQNFPSNQLEEKKVFERLLPRQNFFFTVLCSHGFTLATEIWHAVPELGVYFSHIAVDRQMHGLGFGSEAYSLFLELMKNSKNWGALPFVFGGVSPPSSRSAERNSNRLETINRFMFYERAGWKILPDIGYAAPDLRQPGGPSSPLLLYLTSPVAVMTEIHSQKVAEVVSWLYHDYYHGICGLPLAEIMPLFSDSIASLIRSAPVPDIMTDFDRLLDLIVVHKMVGALPNYPVPLQEPSLVLP